MSDQEFRARDKKVQKMTRDGLTEKNLTRGTEERISGREQDFSYQRTERRGGRPVTGEGRGGGADPGRREVHRGQGSGGNGDRRTTQEHQRQGSDRRTQAADRSDPGRQEGGRNRRNPENNGGEQNPHRNRDGGREQKASENNGNWKQEDPERGAGQNSRRRREATGENRENRSRGEAAGENRENRSRGETAGEGRDRRSRGEPEKKDRDRRQKKRREREKPEDTGQGADEKADSGEEKPRRQKQYDRAQRRVVREGEKLEKAREKLPKRRKLRYAKAPEGKGGKRLHFETEIIPEHEKKPLPQRMGKAVAKAVPLAAEAKLHQKVREAEKHNVGVEAAHKAEIAVEAGVRGAVRIGRERARTRPYRNLRRAERRMTKAESSFAYEKFLRDNPDMEKKRIKKLLQKQRIKRQYAAAARAAAKEAGKAGGAATAKGAGKVAKVLKELLPGKKTVILVVGIGIMLMTLCGSMLSSCSSMFGGIQSMVIASCYTAEEGDICQSELYYTEMETDLRVDIANTETDYPGYDEYKYVTGTVGHNPYELMAYLSAVYHCFTYAQVEAELERLFGLQYELEREESTETRTRTYTDENGEEQEEEYEWTILTTTLTVTPLSDVIAGSLTAGEQTDLYSVYMVTHGGRQCYANPFDFNWLPYVTSRYGYRIHPVSGDKNLHRGMDIGAAEGTAIHAAQDGTVASAGEAGGYGLCVVIDGPGGYQSKYAHCASIYVSAGQEVRRGDVIATVGSTGVSTGPHLHMEVLHNGEYLNPGYFVEYGMTP